MDLHILYYSNHRVQEDGEFIAYKMTRTLVQYPESYVTLNVKKNFENGNVYAGTINGYCDHKQWWQVQFLDGDCEDWSVCDMKKWLPTFKCGPIIDGVTEHTANVLRARTRDRRKHGRSSPLHAVSQEMVPIITSAEAGGIFELPELYDKSIGTVWKLLKTYVEDDGSRWGLYMAADDAPSVHADDLQNLSADEMQDSYDVELAPLEEIESWIKATAALKALVESNPNARQSRRTRNQGPEVVVECTLCGWSLPNPKCSLCR